MKKTMFSAIAYCLVLALLAGVSVYAFWDTHTLSEGENRNLQRWPQWSWDAWFAGDIAPQVEDFFSDHVYDRAGLVTIAQMLERWAQRPTDVTIVTDVGGMGGAAAPQARETGVQADAAPQSGAGAGGQLQLMETPQESDEDVQDYLVLEDRILQIYNYSGARCERYTEAANALFALFPDYIGKYMLLAPSRIAFEAPEVAAHSADQLMPIDFVYGGLDPLVNRVDAYSPLRTASRLLERLYYRLDHHWTHYGAYLAVQAMWEQRGTDYIPIEEYEELLGDTFLGYLYAKNPSPEYNNHLDELVYYLYQGDTGSQVVYKYDKENPDLLLEEASSTIDPSRQGYYTFVESSYSHAVLQGQQNDASCLLVVGDSYTAAAASWLAAGYEKVVIIDPRYFSGGLEGMMELYEEHEATDFMILNYTGVLESTYYISCMEGLAE